MGHEMPMYSVVSLTSLLQKLHLNKAPGTDCISAEHLLYAGESFLLSVNCLIYALFTGIYPIHIRAQQFPYAETRIGICLTHQITDLWQWGSNQEISAPKFSKRYFFLRYNINLLIFLPRKMSAGCGPIRKSRYSRINT